MRANLPSSSLDMNTYSVANSGDRDLRAPPAPARISRRTHVKLAAGKPTISADELTMVSTKALPVRNGGPVHMPYPLRDPATYASPRVMFMMRSMIHKSIILLALLTACTAFGNTIIVSGIDSAMGMQNIYMDENGAATPIYWSGAIDINVDSYVRQVFCVQLFTDIYLNTNYDTVMDYSDTANLKRVGWLLQNEFPTLAQYTGVALQQQGAAFQLAIWDIIDRKSTRLNSSHLGISYAVFCLKKKKT